MIDFQLNGPECGVPSARPPFPVPMTQPARTTPFMHFQPVTTQGRTTHFFDPFTTRWVSKTPPTKSTTTGLDNVGASVGEWNVTVCFLGGWVKLKGVLVSWGYKNSRKVLYFLKSYNGKQKPYSGFRQCVKNFKFLDVHYNTDLYKSDTSIRPTMITILLNDMNKKQIALLWMTLIKSFRQLGKMNNYQKLLREAITHPSKQINS